MNTALCQDEALVVAPDEMTELVRGDEQCLVQRVAPLLREKDVILDLNQIERIDAAGIAALISLYSLARTYGRKFSVKCVSPRVAEMLSPGGSRRCSHIPQCGLRLAMRGRIRAACRVISPGRFASPRSLPLFEDRNSLLKTIARFLYAYRLCDVGHRQRCAAGDIR